MAPLTAGMLGLQCRPCLGPQQLIAGDYYFVSSCNSGCSFAVAHASQAMPRLPFLMRIFALDLCGNCPGGAKSCFAASDSQCSTPSHYPPLTRRLNIHFDMLCFFRQNAQDELRAGNGRYSRSTDRRVLHLLPATNFSGTFSTCLHDLMCGAKFWSVPGLRAMGQNILMSMVKLDEAYLLSHSLYDKSWAIFGQHTLRCNTAQYSRIPIFLVSIL